MSSLFRRFRAHPARCTKQFPLGRCYRPAWRPFGPIGSRCLTSVIVVASCFAGHARADLFSTYRPVRQFNLPAGAEMFDALADGRVIAISGADVYVETAPNSSFFSLSGTLASADMASFGAAFLRVSPNGQRFAVGNNGGAFGDNYEVGVFSVTTLLGTWYSANHFDAEWYDNSLLAITAGDFVNPSVVTILDTSSPNPQNPSNITVVSNIGGASGGIAFDAVGNLYTGNGFQSGGPSGTGAVRAFAPAEWVPVISGGPFLDFESQGVLVVDVLSASPLDFDVDGNLIVAGGDFSTANESDFVAVVNNMGISSSLMGGGPVNTTDPGLVRRLDPLQENDFNFFTASTNDALGQLYVRDFGSDTLFVYADAPVIPAVSSWAAMSLFLALMIGGTLTIDRNKRPRITSLAATRETR